MAVGTVAGTPREEWAATQGEVWAGEEAYWEYVADADVEGFMTIVDDRFVGWPTHEETPTDAAELRGNVEEWFGEVQGYDEYQYRLEPFANVTAGDIGITYYRSHKEYQDGAESGSWASEITHTWRRTDGEWKLRGGMGRESVLED